MAQATTARQLPSATQRVSGERAAVVRPAGAAKTAQRPQRPPVRRGRRAAALPAGAPAPIQHNPCSRLNAVLHAACSDTSAGARPISQAVTAPARRTAAATTRPARRVAAPAVTANAAVAVEARPTTSVTFKTVRKLQFGQVLKIVGTGKELGSW